MLTFSDAVLNASERYTRWGFLGLTLTPVVGAVVLNHGYDPGVSFCPMLNLTGIPCPGCGMTRSFMAMVRGEVDQAISFHLFGPALLTTFLGLAIFLAIELYQGKKIARTPFHFLTKFRVWVYIFAIYFVYYGIRLFSLFRTGEFYINPFILS
ncbi:DUF2752 domain-containing protein [Candidatus Synechococcus calcipolaris G9]|uniref:DUF2752 domain-containing protein n=1 Tax=Candidatus Synechococcus calcipolaris G9 TaxID=1497997 RepID=A0ABT6EXS5_9SYNE|nr:DUF2752 domain-containing protein [Candidatus Synechococcus calcipolaris]MDG2990304.1 DUF2752 domain-containing protein [Candidatus Synechococcus calcipolaris G9]